MKTSCVGVCEIRARGGSEVRREDEVREFDAKIKGHTRVGQ